MRSAAWMLLLLPLGCAGLRSPAVAAFPPPRTDRELDARLQFLEERLDAGRLHAQLWHWGWLGFESAEAVLGTVGAADAKHADDRAGQAVDAAKSVIGVADILVFRPMPGRHGADSMRGPADAPRAEKLARLDRGEAILEAAAARAHTRWEWSVHLGNLGLNLAGSAVLLALSHERTAAISFATGVVGGEAEIWSEPWRASRDLEDYRALVAGASGRAFPTSWRLAPTPTGVALELRF
jgi:hypothetical protein